MALLHLLGIFLLALSHEVKAECRHPPLASSYRNDRYSGTWYEIGKIQTRFGAAFQKDCVCDATHISSQFPVVGDAEVAYDCRNLTIDGAISTIEGILSAGTEPGNFQQRLNDLPTPADYNVIWLDEDSAIEYDCFKNLVTEDYCVHFMSRTPTLNPDKLQRMIDFAESLDLNPQGLEYTEILQEGCWAERR